jgi:hypothetical protein
VRPHASPPVGPGGAGRPGMVPENPPAGALSALAQGEPPENSRTTSRVGAQGRRRRAARGQGRILTLARRCGFDERPRRLRPASAFTIGKGRPSLEGRLSYDQRRRDGMKKSSSFAAVLIVSGALAATAAASLRHYTVGSKQVRGVGTVGSFSATVKKPYKIILFCEGTGASCGARVVCYRGTKVFTWTRSNLGPYTWNLKKPTWYRMDRCHFRASIRSRSNIARVVVDAVVRT